MGFFTKRTNQRTNRGKRQRSFESLESRWALAGNVSITYLTAGRVLLSGDNFANNIAIVAGAQPNEITITGLNDAATNTATTVGGAASQTISLNGQVQLLVGLSGGNDQFSIAGTLSGISLMINGEDGNDQLSVGQYVAIGGTAPGGTINSNLNANIQIFGGNGNDTIFIGRLYGTPANGYADVYIQGNDGNDTINAYNVFADVFSVDAGIGDDSVNLGYLTAKGEFTLDGGEGNDLLSIYASRTVGIANFYGRGGIDFLALDVNKFDGTTTADAGDGNDTLLFSRSVGDVNTVPSVYLRAGAGDDNVLIGKYYAVVNGATVLANGGSSLSLLQVDLGYGNDTAEIAANVVSLFTLFMGPGNDYAYLYSNLIGTSVELEADWTFDNQFTTAGQDTIRRVNNNFDIFGSGIGFVDHGVESYLYV